MTGVPAAISDYVLACSEHCPEIISDQLKFGGMKLSKDDCTSICCLTMLLSCTSSVSVRRRTDLKFGRPGGCKQPVSSLVLT